MEYYDLGLLNFYWSYFIYWKEPPLRSDVHFSKDNRF